MTKPSRELYEVMVPVQAGIRILFHGKEEASESEIKKLANGYLKKQVESLALYSGEIVTVIESGQRMNILTMLKTV